MARRISSDRRRAIEAVETAYNEATAEGFRAHCAGRLEFIDYTKKDDLEPLQNECLSLCPIAQICKLRARLTKPDHGIWGGEVWENGKRVLRASTPPNKGANVQKSNRELHDSGRES